MSYRLITKALFTVVSATGIEIKRELDVRAYPSPKRDASGAITVDGNTASYKRTGGKGRGTADRRYAYFPLGTESAYIEITEAEATAMVGGTVTVTSIAKSAPAPEAIAVPGGVAVEPGHPVTGEPMPAADTEPTPALTRAQRRAAAKEAATA